MKTGYSIVSASDIELFSILVSIDDINSFFRKAIDLELENMLELHNN